jgi:Ornithine cyclodeaminase/mu-crystallin family
VTGVGWSRHELHGEEHQQRDQRGPDDHGGGEGPNDQQDRGGGDRDAGMDCRVVGARIHVTSVGYNTAGREVDSASVTDALVVVVSREAVLAPPPSGSNDLREPIREGLIGPEHIHAEIGELLGTKPGRSSPDQITLHKSVVSPPRTSRQRS